jgi:Mn2+/Fe2+ NRAMP family transporter
VQTVTLPKRAIWSDHNYVYMTVAVIGTTITPWMQFYLQSSIVEKGITVKQYKMSRLDVIVGSFFTDIVAWFIIVVCAATLWTHGMRNINDPADAAEAMKPLADRFAYILFAAGLFNASFFAASILPISTAYSVCEGLGFESGVDKTFRQAPFFYWLYTLLIVAGAAVVLIPNFPLIKMSILSQVLNGVLLPFVLYFMLKLVNNKALMGKHTNTRWFNVVAWATTVIVVGLTVVMLWQTLHQVVRAPASGAGS